MFSRTIKLRCYSDLSSFELLVGTVQSTRGVGGCVREKKASATLSLQLAKASAPTLSKNKASAARLSQQKVNDTADVQRGGVRVVGKRIAAGAPPLTHICTVGACGARHRRGPPAALPRKACDGMLGAMVRVAQPQVVGARFINCWFL